VVRAGRGGEAARERWCPRVAGACGSGGGGRGVDGGKGKERKQRQCSI
jgi:hypothetical protein